MYIYSLGSQNLRNGFEERRAEIYWKPRFRIPKIFPICSSLHIVILCVVIIIEYFVEFSKERFNNVLTCVKLILGEYLSKDIWNSRILNSENEVLKTSLQKEDLFMLPKRRALMSRKSVSTFSELNSNIQLLCLLLEGIGIFATVLGEHFKRCG